MSAPTASSPAPTAIISNGWTSAGWTTARHLCIAMEAHKMKARDVSARSGVSIATIEGLMIGRLRSGSSYNRPRKNLPHAGTWAALRNVLPSLCEWHQLVHPLPGKPCNPPTIPSPS